MDQRHRRGLRRQRPRPGGPDVRGVPSRAGAVHERSHRHRRRQRRTGHGVLGAGVVEHRLSHSVGAGFALGERHPVRLRRDAARRCRLPRRRLRRARRARRDACGGRRRSRRRRRRRRRPDRADRRLTTVRSDHSDAGRRHPRLARLADPGDRRRRERRRGRWPPSVRLCRRGSAGAASRDVLERRPWCRLRLDIDERLARRRLGDHHVHRPRRVLARLRWWHDDDVGIPRRRHRQHRRRDGDDRASRSGRRSRRHRRPRHARRIRRHDDRCWREPIEIPTEPPVRKGHNHDKTNHEADRQPSPPALAVTVATGGGRSTAHRPRT